jgi:hypothetical protein
MQTFIPFVLTVAFAIFGRVLGDGFGVGGCGGCNGRGDCSDVTDVVLVVTEEIISPACSPRSSLVINGTLPGPELHFHAGQHVHIRF